jgi:hypothetical protein
MEDTTMGVWSFLTQSIGLLGKPIRVPNLQRKFGSAQNYTAIQIEHDGAYDSDFSTGEEEVLLFTDNEIKKARERAHANPEDVAKFLQDHKARDAVD